MIIIIFNIINIFFKSLILNCFRNATSFFGNFLNSTFDYYTKIDWFDWNSYLSANQGFDNDSRAIIFFGSPAHNRIRDFCKSVLTEEINEYR